MSLNAISQIAHLEFFSFFCVPTVLCTLTVFFHRENGQNFMTDNVGSNPSLFVQGGLFSGLLTVLCHDGVMGMSRYWSSGESQVGHSGGTMAVNTSWLWALYFFLCMLPSEKCQEVLCSTTVLGYQDCLTTVTLTPCSHTLLLLGFHVTPRYPFSSYCPFIMAFLGACNKAKTQEPWSVSQIVFL